LFHGFLRPLTGLVIHGRERDPRVGQGQHAVAILKGLPTVGATMYALLLLALLSADPASDAMQAPVSATPAGQHDPLVRFARPAAGILAGGRIAAADLPALRAAGVVRVVDLSRDEETPDFDEAAAVRAAGLEYANLPIAGPQDLDRATVQAFDALLAEGGPVLVHCASGNRVGALAALRAAWLHGAGEEAAIAEGRRWGLTSLEGAVRERLRATCLAEAGQDGRCDGRG